MTSETAPRKYAAALLRQLSAPEMDSAADALLGLAEVMAKVPALERYCAHPQVKHAEKEALLKQVLQAVKASDPVVRFVLLLLQQGELHMLPVIAKSLRSEIDDTQGVQAVDVVSTTALSDAQKKHLTDSLALRLKAKVRMAYEIDPALLGGILVRTNNRVLDGSVRGRLAAMREKLLAD